MSALLFGGMSACGDDADDPDTKTGGDTSGPATETEPGTTEAPGTSGEPTTADAPTTEAGGDTEQPSGDLFGLLNFTFYPATAAGDPEQLGMAGAWRTSAFTTDDFYAVQAWSLHFPPAPAEPDTLENNAIPVPYDWGKADTWVTAGNAFKLRQGDQESVACLVLVEDSFPVYLSDDAPFFDPACAPDPTRWAPGATYDLIAFGGEMFPDAVEAGAVTTPPALELTAPDVSTSLFPLEKAKDLELTWKPGGEDGDRVVIRVIDSFGQLLTVHAADDGGYTIPAAELDKLAVGPASLLVARERFFDLPLPAGQLRVAVRYEVWADPDLF